MSTQHNGIRLSSSKIQEKDLLSGETSAYSLHDKDKSGTEGKTTVRPLAKVVQNKKKLDSPILIAGFPGPGLVGSISTQLHYQQTTHGTNCMCRI